MATYKVKDPQGNVREIQGPDGASDAEVIAQAQKLFTAQPEKPVAGSQPLPSTGDRLSSMGMAAGRGMLMGGPLGAAAAASGEGAAQFSGAMDRVAHKAGEAVSQGIAPYVPAEVAGGAGYVTNVGLQAIPTVLGGAIGRQSAPALEWGGEKLMRMALKPSTTLDPARSAQAVKTMLTTDIPGNILPGANVTAGGIAQIHDKIRTLGNKVEDILSKSTAVVNPANVADALEKPLKKFGNQVTPAADLAAIQKVEDEFLKTYPQLMPIKQAHDLKKGTYAVLGDKAYKGELKAAETEAQKSLASGLRVETEKGAPQIAPINAEQSDLINAVKAAISRDAVSGNKDPIGIGFLAANPIAAAGFMANRSEFIKSLLARALYSGAKPITTAAGATAGGLIGAQSGRER